MNLRSNLNKRVAPPSASPRARTNSNSRKALLDALAAQERLAKAGESSFRAANALGLHFDQRASKRADLNYDNGAAARAGVPIHDQEACFHILSYTPFTQRGICYPTVHHFVMSERFKGSPIESEIPCAASLWEIDRLCEMGEENKWERPDWPQVRLNTLVIGTFLKFRQNADALKTLIRTKQRTIVQENLPAHYQKWIAHEKVEKQKKSSDEVEEETRKAGGSRRSAADFLSQQAAVSTHGDEKTVITGSTHKNLGGAVLMSIRKKLIYAFQADEKSRIKKRQMEILAQQLQEQKKKEEEKAEKLKLQQEKLQQQHSGRNSPSSKRNASITTARSKSTKK
jgi:predicted NAD-dependent protein-ADP-ribosyltransferase YbiA (DUF1768 family)